MPGPPKRLTRADVAGWPHSPPLHKEMKPTRPMKPISEDQWRKWRKGGRKPLPMPDADIVSRIPSPEYKAGWERVFGKARK